MCLFSSRFVGVNASDINYLAGRYDPSVKTPFDAGFEGVGEVVALGLSASAAFMVGQAVAYMAPGSFAEYTVVPARVAIPVPGLKPEYLTLLVSGTTAYISLKELGGLSEGKKVLVTAAAGAPDSSPSSSQRRPSATSLEHARLPRSLLF